MNKTLIIKLPTKFIAILKEALNYRINSMQLLLDNPDTPEEELAKIDYVNDQVILTMIADDLSNPNNQVQADFYQISRNTDKTEMTLQEFGKPIPKDERLIFVFSASSFNEACAINNQFLGFAPYKPMPETIIAKQSYHYIDLQGLDHVLNTILYQPQQFGFEWQCDYQIEGYGEQVYQSFTASDSFSVIKLAMQAVEDFISQFEAKNIQLIRQ